MSARILPGWFPLVASTLLILTSCTGRGADSGSEVADGPDRESEALTRAEYQDRLNDCFRDQGLNVNESGEQVEIEADGFDEALAACEEILGRPPAPAPLTDDEITSIYEQSLAAATCLEAVGYDISEPPSLDEFIETYRLSMQGGPPPWLPHGEVPGMPPESCPQPSLN